MQLTRRSLLAGSAAAGAALSLGSPVRAAAPVAGKQAPGFYRYKVGDYEVTQIADGARTFPMPDGFVVNAKKEEALAAAERDDRRRQKLARKEVVVTFEGGQHQVGTGATLGE